MKNRGDTSILLFPPMWFAGIYETMLGRHDPLYSASVYIGISAILVLGLAYLLALALSYVGRGDGDLLPPRRLVP